MEDASDDLIYGDAEPAVDANPHHKGGSRVLGLLRRFRPRRLLQFRLTTLLWLVLVISILFAWRRDRQLLIEQLTPQRADWGVDEVLGEPNTPGYGDIQTAWASATQDNQKEWLILHYAKSVTPKCVLIHETYNPGAVYQVSAFDRLGIEYVLWTGIDPSSRGKRGVSRIPIPAKFKTNRIKVYIDSPKVRGWNEIDAVGLVSSSGKTQWAVDATASSSYATRYQGVNSLTQLPFLGNSGAAQTLMEAEEMLLVE